MTYRYNKHWGGDANLTTSYNFTNHRVNGWQYDADGRVTNSAEPGNNNSELSYNAAGQLIFKHDYTALTIREDKLNRYYDGDGREVKRTTNDCRITEPTQEACQWTGDNTGYYIRSTVLGGETIAETVMGGGKGLRYVRAGNGILAHLRENYVWQQGGGYYTYDAAYYEHRDSSGMSFRMTKRQMPTFYGDYTDERKAEFDAGATNVGLVSPYNPGPGEPPENPIPLESDSPLIIDGQQVTATVDGVGMSWQMVRNMAAAGALEVNWYYRGHIIGQSPVEATTGGLHYDSSATARRASGIEQPTEISYGTSYVDFGIPQGQTQDSRLFLRGEWLQSGIKTFVEDYLDKNPDCEKFINSLLSNLSTDTNFKLKGDLRYYLNEFGKTGTLEIIPGPQDGINRNGTGGGLYKPSFGEPGYGFYIGTTATFMVSGKNRAYSMNIVLFLHEFIHLIGTRGGNSYFGDEQVVDTLQGMGLLGSDKEILESNPYTKNIIDKRKAANQSLYFGTQIFSPYFPHKCTNFQSNPFPRK